MPSVNLIWEQRAARQKHQQIAVILLVCVGLALTVVAEECGRTLVHRIRCDARIAEYDAVIAQNEERARQNRDLQAQISAMEPLLSLLQQAQFVNLRWVYLMGELDTCVTEGGPAVFHQLNFTGAVPSSGDASSAEKSVVGDLTLAGTAREYADVSGIMRRLEAQRYIAEVRLTQAQLESRDESSPAAARPKGVIRFTVRARFRIPEDEEKQIEAAARATNPDYAATVATTDSEAGSGSTETAPRQ